MENANSYEYLEKIKIAVIENLKKTAPVPSVQMQDVPRQGMGMSDEQEDEMDDLDEDENKDARMTQRQWEKKVQRQEEFEDSDDEDMAEANGVWKPNGRRKGIMDFQNPNAVEDDMQIDSGVATPAPKAAETAADNEDTILEDAEANAASVEADASAPPAESEKQATRADNDGDIDMGDAEEKPTDPAIKKEDIDGASSKSPAGSAEPAGVEVKDKDGTSTSPAGVAKASSVSGKSDNGATDQADGEKKSS